MSGASRRGLVPSALTTYSSRSVLTNVSRLPSGDHSGYSAFSDGGVTWENPLPAGFMVKMWNTPEVWAKAIFGVWTQFSVKAATAVVLSLTSTSTAAAEVRLQLLAIS